MKEILIKSFTMDKGIVSVIPVGCPISENSEINIIDGEPCCVYNDTICPHLSSVTYNMKESRKVLLCNGGQ